MSTFQADIRAAAVSLMEDYAASAGIRLQVYAGRPETIHPPTAFVNGIRETIVYSGPTIRIRAPVVEMIVLHRLFDSAEAAAQKDTFIDGFLDWALTRYHEAGVNTVIGVTATEDLPNYSPEWITERREVYYATAITMEGLGG
jgi:hypothetical protein